MTNIRYHLDALRPAVDLRASLVAKLGQELSPRRRIRVESDIAALHISIAQIAHHASIAGASDRQIMFAADVRSSSEITVRGYTIDRSLVVGRSDAIMNGRPVWTFTLENGRTVTVPRRGWIAGAAMVRRELPAGQVRAVQRVELIDAVRHGQSQREGQGLASRRRP